MAATKANASSGTTRPPPCGAPRRDVGDEDEGGQRQGGHELAGAEERQEQERRQHPHDQSDVVAGEQVDDEPERVPEHLDQHVEAAVAVAVERVGGDEAGSAQRRLHREQRDQRPGQPADRGAHADASLALDEQDDAHRGDDEAELGAPEHGDERGEGEAAPLALLGEVGGGEQRREGHRLRVEVRRGRGRRWRGGVRTRAPAPPPRRPGGARPCGPAAIPARHRRRGRRTGRRPGSPVVGRSRVTAARGRKSAGRRSANRLPSAPMVSSGGRPCGEVPRRLHVPGQRRAALEAVDPRQGDAGVDEEEHPGERPRHDPVGPAGVEARLPAEQQPVEPPVAAPRRRPDAAGTIRGAAGLWDGGQART